MLQNGLGNQQFQWLYWDFWGLITCIAAWCSLVNMCDSSWSDLVLCMGDKSSGTDYTVILFLTHCGVMVSFRLKVEVFFVFLLVEYSDRMIKAHKRKVQTIHTCTYIDFMLCANSRLTLNEAGACANLRLSVCLCWIGLLPNPADTPIIAVKLHELALFGETFAVLLVTFNSMLAAGVEQKT